MMLALSFTIWYITKLNYSYTTEFPIKVNIEGIKFKVPCLVEAKGHRIIAHRSYLAKRVNVKISDIQLTPSLTDSLAYVIDPLSLQNIISIRKGDIRIISIGKLPEITLEEDEK